MTMRGSFGLFAVLARNCVASTLDYIVMQMRKINREKGYCNTCNFEWKENCVLTKSTGRETSGTERCIWCLKESKHVHNNLKGSVESP